MPRGKNYVNNNKGMSLQGHKNQKSMQLCFYGSSCRRSDCIYRHDNVQGNNNKNVKKSNEPCMPYLAGLCTFNASSCHKRHPPKDECEKLIAKYKSMKCRYGDHCKTKGCLYIHPGEADEKKNDTDADFPPLSSNPPTKPTVLNTAWRPAPPTAPGPAPSTSSPSSTPPPPPKDQDASSPPKKPQQASPSPTETTETTDTPDQSQEDKDDKNHQQAQQAPQQQPPPSMTQANGAGSHAPAAWYPQPHPGMPMPYYGMAPPHVQPYPPHPNPNAPYAHYPHMGHPYPNSFQHYQQHQPPMAYHQQDPATGAALNINAKEFIPGNSS